MKKLILLLFACSLLPVANSTIAAINTTAVQPQQKKIVYVLLFKWKETAAKDNINELKSLWEGLVKKVKGFNSFEMIKLESGDYGQAVVIEFSSEAAHQTYLQHEDHITLSKKGPALVEKFMEYSYWK